MENPTNRTIDENKSTEDNYKSVIVKEEVKALDNSQPGNGSTTNQTETEGGTTGDTNGNGSLDSTDKFRTKKDINKNSQNTIIGDTTNSSGGHKPERVRVRHRRS